MVAKVRMRGGSVLAAALLNRGTAFTLAEREALGLTGLLPVAVSTIEGQLRRTYGQYQRQPADLRKNLYLATLRRRRPASAPRPPGCAGLRHRQPGAAGRRHVPGQPASPRPREAV